jgi:hypothetical protein
VEVKDLPAFAEQARAAADHDSAARLEEKQLLAVCYIRKTTRNGRSRTDARSA